jgi:hypothetical protein
MKADDYITQNLPFYHITKMECLDSILQNGLLKSRKKGARNGICVVRTDADDIISEIIDRQLQETGEELFGLIRLFPQNHNISVFDFSTDPIDEEISPICNYIVKEPLHIQETDIIRKNIPVGLWHGTNTEFEGLTDYLIDPPPINR